MKSEMGILNYFADVVLLRTVAGVSKRSSQKRYSKVQIANGLHEAGTLTNPVIHHD